MPYPNSDKSSSFFSSAKTDIQPFSWDKVFHYTHEGMQCGVAGVFGGPVVGFAIGLGLFGFAGAAVGAVIGFFAGPIVGALLGACIGILSELCRLGDDYLNSPQQLTTELKV